MGVAALGSGAAQTERLMAEPRRSTEMRCRRKRRELKVRCVCGCDRRESPGNFFLIGHDRKLDAYLENNAKDATKDADKLARVDWCNVPLCFFGGKYADEIRERRTGKDCAGKWELTQEIGRPRCHLD